jgi:lysine biosynthesis protein LysW
MGVEIVRCPACKQRLGLQSYVVVGALLACANETCAANLRVVSLHPLRVEQVPESATYSVDYRPESYG